MQSSVPILSHLKPSPLGPCHFHACLRVPAMMASDWKVKNQSSVQPQKRATKGAFLRRDPNQEQDKKRQVFLNKVRKASEEKTWEVRSDQV